MPLRWYSGYKPVKSMWKLTDERVQINGLPVQCHLCHDRFSPQEHQPHCPLANRCITCKAVRGKPLFPNANSWFAHSIQCHAACILKNGYKFPEPPPQMVVFNPVAPSQSSYQQSIEESDQHIRNEPAVVHVGPQYQFKQRKRLKTPKEISQVGMGKDLKKLKKKIEKELKNQQQ